MANSKNFSSWPRLVISTTSIWTKTGLDRLWGARTVAQAHHLARGGSYTLQCCGVSLSHEQWENQEFYMEAALQKWTDAWGILLTGLCCWGLSSVLPLTKNKRPHSGKWIPTDFSNDPTRRGHVILVAQKCLWMKNLHLDKKRTSQKSPEIEKIHQKAIPSWNFSTPAILPKIASTHPTPTGMYLWFFTFCFALRPTELHLVLSWQSKPTAALHYVARFIRVPRKAHCNSLVYYHCNWVVYTEPPKLNSSPLKSSLYNRKVVFQPPFFSGYV